MALVIIDAHCHILPDRIRRDPASVADPWFTSCHSGPKARYASPEDLVAAMDEAGVDRAVCFTWPFREAALCAEANRWLAGEVRRFPDRLIGFGIVNPAHPDAAAEVIRCAHLGLRGIGELNADAQGWSLEDLAGLAPVVSAAVEAGLPWTLHCSEPIGHDYPGKGRATPDKIARLATEYPELALICAHLGGGLPFSAHMPEVRALCRRLWFDTAASPFLYEPTAERAVIDLCGADRLLFGSDYPLLTPKRLLRRLGSLALAPGDLAAITGGNLLSILGRP